MVEYEKIFIDLHYTTLPYNIYNSVSITDQSKKKSILGLSPASVSGTKRSYKYTAVYFRAMCNLDTGLSQF